MTGGSSLASQLYILGAELCFLDGDVARAELACSSFCCGRTLPMKPASRGRKGRDSENPFILHQENGSSLDTSLSPLNVTASPLLTRTTVGIRPRVVGAALCRATVEAAVSVVDGETVRRRQWRGLI